MISVPGGSQNLDCELSVGHAECSYDGPIYVAEMWLKDTILIIEFTAPAMEH